MVLFLHTGQDFIISVGTPEQISFGQFEMAKDINVTSVHDNLGEGDELIILELTNDINNIIDVMSDQKTTQITIIEDDGKQVVFVWTQLTKSGACLPHLMLSNDNKSLL